MSVPFWSVAVLFVISVAIGLTAYFAAVHSYHASQAAQRSQSAVFEHRLCTTLGRLAALQPPAGDPAANPSRTYESQLHAVLAELGPDVGCGTRR